MNAAMFKSLEAVELLVKEMKVDVNTVEKKCNALHYAGKTKNDTFWHSASYYHNGPNDESSMFRQFQIAKLLIEAGSDLSINKNHLISDAISTGTLKNLME